MTQPCCECACLTCQPTATREDVLAALDDAYLHDVPPERLVEAIKVLTLDYQVTLPDPNHPHHFIRAVDLPPAPPPAPPTDMYFWLEKAPDPPSWIRRLNDELEAVLETVRRYSPAFILLFTLACVFFGAVWGVWTSIR